MTIYTYIAVLGCMYMYVRMYLMAIQGGVWHAVCLSSIPIVLRVYIYTYMQDTTNRLMIIEAYVFDYL